MEKMIILPMDGQVTGGEVLIKASAYLAFPETANLVSHIKLNDALFSHGFSSPFLVEEIGKLPGSPKVMLDTKTAETWGTVENVALHFADCQPDIMTVYSNVNGMALVKIRSVLPKTKIALVSALTDSTPGQIVRQYGHFPDTKILHDVRCKQLEYEEAIEKLREKGEGIDSIPQLAIDAIVCSPHELEFLRKNLGYAYIFITPGIRDEWMASGQQARSTGVAKAIRMGADFVVMGSQLTKGNPKKNITPYESCTRTAKEIAKINRVKIVPNAYLTTLFNCDGYYNCPKDTSGKRKGPLVGYAGKYDTPDGSKKNFVGDTYYNFAKAEQYPHVYDHFAAELAKKIRAAVGEVDVVIGAPMGGLFLAADVSRYLGCRRIFAEKKVICLADEANGQKEVSELIIKRHEIYPGERVGVIEDVCNNFSTTTKTEALINSFGAELVFISCALNRSDQTIWNGKPVISLEHRPEPQWQQEDQSVSEDIASGNVVWTAKKEWFKLKKAMIDASQ